MIVIREVMYARTQMGCAPLCVYVAVVDCGLAYLSFGDGGSELYNSTVNRFRLEPAVLHDV